MKTQAMAAAPGSDPNRTSAMAAAQLPSSGISTSIIATREATMGNGPAREQFLLEISAGTGVDLPGAGISGPRTPLNLCLVIDRSGSMEGLPLDYVKNACQYVVDMLSPQDTLSIVTFEEMVDVLMPPQRVTNKQAIKDGIMRLQAGNTTNLSDGLSLALSQLAQANESGRATRMVVFTDGEPTAGIKDFGQLVQIAADVKARGVSATFLGFGSEYNEELLASMSKKAGGNYYYIQRPELIPEIFRAELEKLLSVAATSVKLEVNLSRWVTLKAATGHNVPPAERSFTLDLADVERGSSIEQVFDLEFPNHPLGEYRVAAAKLTYEDAIQGRPQSVDVDFFMEFTADAAKYGADRNPRVVNAANIAAASRTVERTIMGLKTGQLTMAAAVSDLQKTQALLLSDGRQSEAQEVTMALRAIQSGDTGQAEKTLMGTMVQLDQGKKSQS